MPKVTLTHIDRLSRGKKSGIHIGSRNVPHHLYAHEQVQFEVAQKKGYLLLDTRSRVNIQNIWEKYCVAKQIPNVICQKLPEGKAQVVQNKVLIYRGTLGEAKKLAQGQITTHLQ